MKIVLSSTNKAKIQAVKDFFNSLDIEFDLKCVDVDSGVSKTPESDNEGIQGCINRISEAKKIGNADIYIGMEGIITKNLFGTFLCGWVCIENKLSEKYFGCSAKCQLPLKIAENSNSFRELSQLVKETYPTRLTKDIDIIGTNGIITNNLYTRVDEFQDALKCAFGYMQNSAVVE